MTYVLPVMIVLMTLVDLTAGLYFYAAGLAGLGYLWVLMLPVKNQ